MIFLLFFTWISNAQQSAIAPVKWDSNILKISDAKYAVTFTGIIDKKWHIFCKFKK